MEELNKREKLIWLACSMENDGHLDAHLTTADATSVAISYSNKHPAILNYFKGFLEDFDVEYTSSGSVITHLSVSKMKNQLKLLELIEPFLVAKREVAQASLLFLKVRLPRKNKYYTKEERSLGKEAIAAYRRYRKIVDR